MSKLINKIIIYTYKKSKYILLKYLFIGKKIFK